MGTVTLPHNLVDGTTAYGSQVKADLDAITAQVNGNLQDVNVAVGAAIAGTKLAAASVPTSVLVDDCVTDAKLADHASSDASRAVGTNHIKDAAVTAGKLGTNSVVLSKVKLTTVTINLKTATPYVGVGWPSLGDGAVHFFYNIDLGGAVYATPSNAIVLEVAVSSTAVFTTAGPPYGLKAALYYDTTVGRYLVMVSQHNTAESALVLNAMATTVNVVVRLVPVS